MKKGNKEEGAFDFNGANLPIFILNKENLKIIHVNAKARDFFDLKEEEIQGKAFNELFTYFPKDIFDHLDTDLPSKSNELFILEKVTGKKYLIGTNFFLDEGRILLIVNRKYLSKKAITVGSFAAILDNIGEAVWIMDEKQRVVYSNEKTKDIFGIDAETIIGENCWGIIHGTKAPVKGCPFIEAKRVGRRASMFLKVRDKWLEITFDPIFDNRGEFRGGVHIARDITEHKKYEAELLNKEREIRKSYNLFRLMADTMQDMVWAKDKNKRYIFANKALCENLLNAKDTQEPIGKDDIFFAKREREAHPENPEWHTFGEVCADSDQVTMDSGKPMQFYEYGNVKGKFLYLDVRKAPMYDEKGELIGVVGSARDITQQKLYEEILKESEERYRELFENAPVGYLILDTKGIIKEANNAICQRLGYKKSELEGKDVRELVPQEDRELVDKNIRTILEKGEFKAEVRSLSKDGKISYTLLREVKIKLPNGEEGILSASLDITQRKRAEEKLKEREEQLWSLINSTAEDIVCFKDGEGRWLIANDADVELFQLHNVDYYGKTDAELSEYTHPIYKEAFLTCMKTDAKTWAKGSLHRGEEIIPIPDGSVKIFDVIKVPLFNEDGSRKGLIVLGRDITKIKQAQAQIKESEELFRRVWENSKDGMRLLDEKGIIVDVNNSFVEMVGLSREELIGKPYTVIFKNEIEGTIERFMRNFKDRNVKDAFDVKIELQDGSVKWFELSNAFIEPKKGKILLLSVFRDITQRKELVTKLSEAKEKAEEMSRLKTQFFLYMSHELRTPFMGIMGYAQLLRDEVQDESWKEMATGILDTSKRMLDTLTNILNVTKLEFDKEERDIKDVNLKSVAFDVVESFKQAAHLKGLELKTKMPQENLILKTDRRIIYSILTNLLNNAIKFTDKGFIEIRIKKDDGKIRMEVEDTGVGIPEDKKDIVWQEFRQVSEGNSRAYQGTGLGLTIVKKYVEILNGKIWFESEVNKGTTFYIELNN